MENNKGFTLIEIIVAMVVMAIVFTGVFVAFMSINKVNVVSRVSQSQTSIATSLLESLYDTKYNDINADTQFTIPTVYKWNSTDKTYSETGGVKTIKLDKIDGVASTYSVDMVVTPFSVDNDTRAFDGFSTFDILGDKGTYKIDIDKVSSSDKTYDELALDEFKSRSNAYINDYNNAHKDATPLNYISEEDISAHINCQCFVLYEQTGSDTGNLQVKLVYLLDSSVTNNYVGSADKAKIETIVYEGSALSKLSNIIILTSDRTCMKAFELFITNGNTISNSGKFNIFVVKKNETLSETGTLTSFDINTYDYNDVKTLGTNYTFSQIDPDMTKVQIFTNIEKLQQKISSSKLQIYGNKDLQDRIYNVDITVKEKATNTFEHLSETVLVLDYD